MASRLQPDGTRPTATQRRGAASPQRAPDGLPGWRPLLAAVGVVLVLAIALHLLYR
ncbi:MAG TPA: hypothetical protein VNE67_17500 [Acetobacteraceae bacterium]|nr:hypothetical protein [Acetobacteraceae bacterium]